MSPHLRIVAVEGVDVGVAERVADHFHSHLASLGRDHLRIRLAQKDHPWLSQDPDLESISPSFCLSPSLCCSLCLSGHLDIGDIKGLLRLPGNRCLARDCLALGRLKLEISKNIFQQVVFLKLEVSNNIFLQVVCLKLEISRNIFLVCRTLPQRPSSLPCSSFW